MMRQTRLGSIAAPAGMVLPAAAQTFPNKPIRIVLSYPAGGPIDMTTRPLAQRLTGALGNPVVVDNRGSANGIIGTKPE